MRELRRPNRTDAVPTVQAMAAIEVIKKSARASTPVLVEAPQFSSVEQLASSDSKNTAYFFAKSIEFSKTLSIPEIHFLMLVIARTSYGTIAEVPIPRSDIIKGQVVASLAVKQIREKLESLGLILAIQKRIGRGSETWHYSLILEKFTFITQ